jgi:hypothetical protein
MLGGFSDWCAAVDLPERVPEVEHAALSRASGTPVRPAALFYQYDTADYI